jgi:hypothetical protein
MHATRKRKYPEKSNTPCLGQMKNPGSLPFLGHCWRSALLAAFRLVGFSLEDCDTDRRVRSCWPARLLCSWCVCGALGWRECRFSTWMIVSSLLGGSSNEPLQDGVQVGLFLCAYAVAGRTCCRGPEVECLPWQASPGGCGALPLLLAKPLCRPNQR